MNYAPLDRELAKYNVYPSSFAEVREGFRESYGEHGWIGKLATFYSGTTDTKDKGYKAARRSIERASTGQYKEPKKAEYRAGLATAGQTLDPIRKNAPASGITITIDFYDPSTGSRGRQKERSTPALYMDHQTAQQYINLPRPDYTFLFDLWGEKKIGTNLWGEEGPYPADILDVISS